MEIPKEIRTYCPYCRKHTVHKVSVIWRKSPPKGRTLAWGNLKHEKKTKGYTSKVAGKKESEKQRHRNVLELTCKECGKKHYRTYGRSKKKVEVKR